MLLPEPLDNDYIEYAIQESVKGHFTSLPVGDELAEVLASISESPTDDAIAEARRLGAAWVAEWNASLPD